MASQTARTPHTLSAGQVEFRPPRALAHPVLIVGFPQLRPQTRAGGAAKAHSSRVAVQLNIGVADAAVQQADQSESGWAARPRLVAHQNFAILQTNRRRVWGYFVMLAELACFEQQCRARFPIDEAIYNCPGGGGAAGKWFLPKDAWATELLKKVWRTRRTSNDLLEQSGIVALPRVAAVRWPSSSSGFRCARAIPRC